MSSNDMMTTRVTSNGGEADEPSTDKKHSFKHNQLVLLAFGSLGVVYGDIGTSPLYAFASIFKQEPTKQDVLGAASLTFWMLTIILMVKYVMIVLRADDNGEGGTFALYSLLCRRVAINPLGYKEAKAVQSLVAYSHQMTPMAPTTVSIGKHSIPRSSLAGCTSSKLVTAFQSRVWLQRMLLVAALAATAMVLGDGVFTPAISVLSAVSGLTTVVPSISNDIIVAITVAILMVLFCVQQFGTHKVSLTFAPVVLLWFLSLTTISFYRFANHGFAVFAAVNPWHVVKFFKAQGVKGWHAMADAVLVVTGAEALFADLGHFSRGSITLSASALAYPALALTYLSQAAFLTDHPAKYSNLFWDWTPQPVQWPMLILATAATIIASQALISASFSLVSQAIKLGVFPTMAVKHTGAQHQGQVYIAEINYILMVTCVLVVGGFRDTVALGHAYGLTVVTVMAMTTLLLVLVMLMVWSWSLLATAAVCLPLLVIEMAILTASFPKIEKGAWVALVFAAVAVTVMLIWWYVRRLKHGAAVSNEGAAQRSLLSLFAVKRQAENAAECISGQLRTECTDPKLGASHCLDKAENYEVMHIPSGRLLARIGGVGVYHAPREGEAPQILVHLLDLIPALPEVVVLLTVHHAPVSNVAESERFLVYSLMGLPNAYQVVARYGYMDQPCHDEAFIRGMLQFMSIQIRLNWLAEARALSHTASSASSGNTPHIMDAANPHTVIPAVPAEGLLSQGRETPTSNVQAELVVVIDPIASRGASSSELGQVHTVAPTVKAVDALNMERGSKGLAGVVQQGEFELLQGGAGSASVPLQVAAGEIDAGSVKASSGTSGAGSGGTLKRSSCSPGEVVLERASKQGVMQAVAHEVVQSRPGSGLVKQVLVDGIYPVLSLGGRRAAHAMQLPPTSTLEVVMAIQV